MTRQEATQTLVVPSSVALAAISLCALAIKSWVPAGDTLNAQLSQALVERDRQYREDRNQVLLLLMEVKGDIKRLEGKLEK